MSVRAASSDTRALPSSAIEPDRRASSWRRQADRSCEKAWFWNAVIPTTLGAATTLTN